jgi:hypothetical protein
MSNRNEIVLKSDTRGLWSRYITRFIATLVASWYGLWLIAGIIMAIFKSPIISYISIIMVLLGILFFAYKTLLNSPLSWDTTVIFDIEQRLLKVAKNKDIKKQSNVLDDDGHIIPFSEIQYITVEYYDSFLFNAYYLLKYSKNDKIMKLLSIRDADKYTILMQRITREMRIPVK